MQGRHGAASLIDAMELLAEQEKEDKAHGRDDEDGNEGAENSGGRGRGLLPLGRSIAAGVRHGRRQLLIVSIWTRQSQETSDDVWLKTTEELREVYSQSRGCTRKGKGRSTEKKG